MEAIVETTGGLFPAHTYYLDGTTLLAYIKAGESKPFRFKNGIKGFDKRGRKFSKGSTKPFTVTVKAAPFKANVKLVTGSKGEIYTVNLDDKSCTCSGYTYRGTCKHTKDL